MMLKLRPWNVRILATNYIPQSPRELFRFSPQLRPSVLLDFKHIQISASSYLADVGGSVRKATIIFSQLFRQCCDQGTHRSGLDVE